MTVTKNKVTRTEKMSHLHLIGCNHCNMNVKAVRAHRDENDGSLHRNEAV